MNIVVAPDSYKGSLTSIQVSETNRLIQLVASIRDIHFLKRVIQPPLLSVESL